MSDKKWWDKWCQKTPTKHEKHCERERPTETKVQTKLNGEKKKKKGK